MIPYGIRDYLVATNEATPSLYSGPCPVTIKLSSQITVADGRGILSYTWIRNDGASGPIESLIFDSPGTKRVTTDWLLGSSGTRWMALKVIEPYELISDHIDFVIECQ